MSVARITRKQARDYVRRWKLVNQTEIDELRRTPLELKLQQLAVLMASVDEMGWREGLEEGEAEVRRRWARLRKKLSGKRLHD